MKQPNIIFIFPDQMRGNCMGFLGKEPVITPNLDKFASESLVLTEAASNYPVCVPYRTILMTGKYPISNGIYVNCFLDGRDLPDHHTWWTDVLHNNGYSNAYFGKWHITLPIGGKNRGGSSWLLPEKRHGIKYWEIQTKSNHMSTDYVSWDKAADQSYNHEGWTVEYETDLALDFIRNENDKYRNSDQPFSMIISWNPPHAPYHTVPEKYVDMYDKDVEEYCIGIDNIPPADTDAGEYYRKTLKDYYGAITGLDENFGRIMKCLQYNDIEEDTIVIFSSDHGDIMNKHELDNGEFDHKNMPWDDAMHIPFIIRWPGKIEPRHDDLLISVADYYPSILDLVGLKGDIPESVEGLSYAPLFLGENQERPSSQLYIHIEEPNGDISKGRRGVRTHKYTMCIEKMSDGIKKMSGKPESYFLYDNINDPFQMSNIAEKNYDIVKELIDTELKPWLRKTEDLWIVPE